MAEERQTVPWANMIEEEVEAVSALIRKGEISTSPAVKEFQEAFRAYHGSRYALAQCNGTSTLHAAYFAVGIGPGDEVITPAYSWHLQAIPILAAHGIPVFCDIDPKTLNIDPAKIEEQITPQTKAIAVLHAFGHPAEMDEIMPIAKKHGLRVVEDCSHAHGATYKGQKIGTFGDVGCFSLQGSKLMTGGEGGILITNDTECYERAITLGHYEHIPSLTMEKYRRYATDPPIPPACLGYKYRIHPFAAAMANIQLRYLDARNASRRENTRYFSEGLSGIPGIEPPYEAPHIVCTWLNYLPRFHSEQLGGISRETFIEALNAEGLSVSTGRAGYLPLHYSKLFQDKDMYGKGCPFRCSHVVRDVAYRRGDFPVTETMHEILINLPIFRDPWDKPEIDRYVETIRKVAERFTA